MKEELVSIIIPVHNASKYIVETIESVQAQTYSNWELILVDDVSTDNSVAVIQENFVLENQSQIILLQLAKNSGAAYARNAGIAQAKGRYICFLDADDLWDENKLKNQISFASQHQSGFVFTGYEFTDEAGNRSGKIVKVPIKVTYKQALQNTTIFTSTVMLDTTIIDKKNIQFPFIKSEDTALWWNLLKEVEYAYGLNENLVRYRRIEGSLSSDKKEALYRIWNLYRRAEHLSFCRSSYNFVFWAIRAVLRRL